MLLLLLVQVSHAQRAFPADAPEATAEASGGSAVVLSAPPPPARSSLPEMTLTDWSLLGAAGLFRYFDYKTTVKALSDPRDFHELELPQALVDNHAGFAAFEAGTVVANVWVYQWLVRHGHRRLARAGQVINLGAIGGTVVFNEYNLAKYYPGHR